MTIPPLPGYNIILSTHHIIQVNFVPKYVWQRPEHVRYYLYILWTYNVLHVHDLRAIIIIIMLRLVVRFVSSVQVNHDGISVLIFLNHHYIYLFLRTYLSILRTVKVTIIQDSTASFWRDRKTSAIV